MSTPTPAPAAAWVPLAEPTRVPVVVSVEMPAGAVVPTLAAEIGSYLQSEVVEHWSDADDDGMGYDGPRVREVADRSARVAEILGRYDRLVATWAEENVNDDATPALYERYDDERLTLLADLAAALR